MAQTHFNFKLQTTKEYHTTTHLLLEKLKLVDWIKKHRAFSAVLFFTLFIIFRIFTLCICPYSPELRQSYYLALIPVTYPEAIVTHIYQKHFWLDKSAYNP